jgi:hypothetical protein
MSMVSIGEFARLSRLSPKALRRYDPASRGTGPYTEFALSLR